MLISLRRLLGPFGFAWIIRISLTFALGLSVARGQNASTESPLVLDNGILRMEFSPSQGRVTYFGLRGGVNMLWINSPEDREAYAAVSGWRNYGGEKIWPGPQALWPYAQGRSWPPDGAFDGSGIARLDEVSPLSMKVTFPPSSVFGVQLQRCFDLDPKKPILRIRNRLTRVKASVMPIQIWSVTQIPLPQSIWLHVAATGSGETAYVNLNRAPSTPPFTPPSLPDEAVREHSPWVVVTPVPSARFKLGTLGGVLAAADSHSIFVQQIKFDGGNTYPEASSVQVLQEARFVELEMLSPLLNIPVGETHTVESTWFLLPLGPAHRDGYGERQIEGMLKEFL